MTPSLLPRQRASFVAMRHQRQRGATMIVGLIMMVLITLVVVGAFMVSTSNLKSVHNQQLRDEAVAAANRAVESYISTAFTGTATLTTTTLSVDFNRDGTADYTVTMPAPTCVRAVQYGSSAPSESELASALTGSNWGVDWDLDARVTDAVTGATVRVRQGIRVLLSDTQKTTYCP